MLLPLLVAKSNGQNVSSVDMSVNGMTFALLYSHQPYVQFHYWPDVLFDRLESPPV